MTDHDDVAQRAYHQPDPDRIHLREDDGDDGLFRVRMPISSTLEARDGVAFERDRLDGWATQINEATVPVYGDHGRNPDLAGSRYSAFGKLGYYDDAEVREIDDMPGEHELVADTVMMDPDTLSEDTGALRENMARLKAQVDRDMPITQSVGWSDETGDRDLPGDSDLLEGSIVGIPSDAQASSHNAATEMARAATAANPDADPEQLVEDFRAVVMGSDTRDEEDMTDEENDSPDDGSGDDRDESDGIGADEFREQMLEMQRTQTEALERQGETLGALADSLREDDDEDDEEEDDEDEENSADADEERTVTVDGEEMTAAEAVEDLRDDVEDAEPDTPGDDEDGERGEEPDNDRTNDPRDLL